MLPPFSTTVIVEATGAAPDAVVVVCSTCVEVNYTGAVAEVITLPASSLTVTST